MNQIEPHKVTIGSEIPYRRSQMERRTGSLVFDRHLDQTLAEAPEQSASQSMPDRKSPLSRGQVS
ncbi:hypothetical protein ABVV53_05515 [Novosphingobium sp. RD2P27]|uniref:Uncharacterized protein n=1 Tax=Novosphingobium kalidii TaxID=3230299 RepID=A0ABV2CZP1_9SPHN